MHHYRPSGPVRGLVVLAPGSRGGMGPGQTPSTIGKFDPAIRCIYTLLARQLSAEPGLAVCHFNWRKNPTRKGAPPGTLKSPVTLQEGASDVGLAARYLRATHGAALPLVLVGFSFGSPAVVAAGGISCGCVQEYRARHGHAPAAASEAVSEEDEDEELDDEEAEEDSQSAADTVRSSVAALVSGLEANVLKQGGGEVVAAAASSGGDGRDGRDGGDLGPLAGVISLSGGLRVAKDGSPHLIAIGDGLKGGASRSLPKDYRGCDSESCVRALGAACVPLLLTHGLADVTVDPRASEAIFDAATGPKAIEWLDGADHHCRARFDELLGTLQSWVPTLVKRHGLQAREAAVQTIGAAAAYGAAERHAERVDLAAELAALA